MRGAVCVVLGLALAGVASGQTFEVLMTTDAVTGAETNIGCCRDQAGQDCACRPPAPPLQREVG